MSDTNLTEEEVFANDKDPLEALSELRASGEDFKVGEETIPDEVFDEPADDDPAPTDENPVDETQESSDPNPDEPANNTADQANEDPNPAAEKADEKDPDDSGEESKGDSQDAEETEPKKLTFKANGQDFEFTEEEIMKQFGTVFGQAMNYTQKMQAIAPYRKMISAIQDENINEQQLNLAIDALKGNKQAIKQLMDANEITAFDLDDNEGQPAYQPTSYGKDEAQLALQEVVNTISADPEYQTTVQVIDQRWDQASRNIMASNPQMISGLHNDIKSGIYAEVAAEAAKMKVLDDGNAKSDLEYYMLAGQARSQRLQQAQQQAQQQRTVTDQVAETNSRAQAAVQDSERASSEAERRRAASPTRTRADRKTVVDYLDDDDEAFDEWYNNLQKNQ